MTEAPLTVETAAAHIAEECLRSGPIERVGAELEWLVHDASAPSAPVPKERVEGVLADCPSLPRGSRLTCEPGGQIELSTRAGDGLLGCLSDATVDLAVLRATARRHELTLNGAGLDPVRAPRRLLTAPRYHAMAEHFAPFAPSGPLMMCSTASVQVCLDAGPDDTRLRWQLAHALGPVLVASFANSPRSAGAPTGWKSTRWAVWSDLDPTRTAPVRLGPGQDVRSAYAEYTLDAAVMCVRSEAGPWRVPSGLTFRDWIASPGDRAPTLDDLDYHLSTLFPPVRARGYLELRMIDAQPDDGWRVPLAVATVLLDDPLAADLAWDATAELEMKPDAWLTAAREGLSDPSLARAARACFTAAADALGRLSAPQDLRIAVDAFRENYVERDRCPADDQIDT